MFMGPARTNRRNANSTSNNQLEGTWTTKCLFVISYHIYLSTYTTVEFFPRESVFGTFARAPGFKVVLALLCFKLKIDDPKRHLAAIPPNMVERPPNAGEIQALPLCVL
jgi:hypothetical protein